MSGTAGGRQAGPARETPAGGACATVLLCAAVLGGCTTQVSYVRVREPLEKGRLTGVEVVAVLPFRNTSGDAGAGGVVESMVRSALHKGFTVAGRRDLRRLAMERSLQESDLIDPDTRREVRMTGADAAVLGEVSKYECRERTGHEDIRTTVREPRVTHDRHGRRRVTTVERVLLVRRPTLRVTATVSVSISLVRLSDGTALVGHAQTLTFTDRGGGSSRKEISQVQPGDELLNRLTQTVVGGFLVKVVPTPVTESRRLDRYWGDGVDAAENGDWEIASRVFWAEYLENRDDPAALNNVGVCIEAVAGNSPAKLRKAVEFYEGALELDYEDIYSENLRRAEAVLDEVLRHGRDAE